LDENKSIENLNLYLDEPELKIIFFNEDEI